MSRGRVQRSEGSCERLLVECCSNALGGGLSNAAFGRMRVGNDGAVGSRFGSGPPRCNLGAGCTGPRPVLQTLSVDRVPSLDG